MKNTARKNAAKTTANSKPGNDQIDLKTDLFAVEPNSKPVAGAFATAAQIVGRLPFLAETVDEKFLRRRGFEINPRTGAPWIPKPRNNQFEISPTIIGLLEWFAAKAAERDGLPASYDSMQAMENSFLRVPKEFTRWALKNGASPAQIGGSRIDPRPVLEKAAEILRLIPSGKITGIAGLEEINTNLEIGLKVREEREALQRKALIEKGEMLMASDGKWAIWKLDALEMFREVFEAPIKTVIARLPKTINRQHKTIIGDEEKSRKCAGIVTEAITGLLDKLREKIPVRKSEAAEIES
jgi:hypothetical protein